MDCSAEEQMVRMKLEDVNSILKLEFNLPERTLIVFHYNENDLITNKINELQLDSKLIRSDIIGKDEEPSEDESKQTKLLWTVLVINFGFFAIEMTTGLLSRSMGLVADSLDMFADAAVYGLSLLAIGKALSTKKFVAKLAGYFQFTLAVLGFSEVVRRFIGFEGMPDFKTMIIVSIFALMANILSLYLLQKTKSKEAHLQASMIFTSNDIIVNGGVIVAGILVNLLSSKIPDLVIGAIVFSVVIRGSFRILKLAK
jgi:Co/Zn/Cd efflux system component